jgi:glutathione S-transferase
MNRETILGVIVSLLAVVLYLGLAMRVGILRGKHGVIAPATSGHPQFERAYRVHLNTAEQYIAFLPLLWMATLTFHALYWLPAAFGIVFLLARILYMRLYMAAPQSRIPGAFLTMFAQLGLLVLAIVGLVQAWPQNW